MSAAQDINHVLRQIADLEPTVTLLNEYRGIPVCQEGLMRETEAGTATLEVHPHQAVCLALEGETVMQSRLLSLALRARVIALSPAARVVRLAGFNPTVYTTEGRRALRLRPHTAAFASIQFETWRLTGALANISPSGLRVNLPADQVDAAARASLLRGAPVQLRVQLPGTPRPADFTGLLTYATPHSHVVSLGVNLAGDAGAQDALADYIARREAAVLPELDRIYHQMVAVEERNGNAEG